MNAESSRRQAATQIIGFVCNWGAYGAVEMAGANRRAYPAGIRLVKVMCLGRLNPGLLLQAFEMGADGVMLLGCPTADCHYECDAGNVEGVFRQTRKLLGMLGIGEERLALAHVPVGRDDILVKEITYFTKRTTPLRLSLPAPTPPSSPTLGPAIAETRAYACLDCGRCTATCPVSTYDPDFSPRRLVDSAVRGEMPEGLWSCLSCGMCETRCQSGVRYTSLVGSLRQEAYTSGQRGQCSHSGALQSMMRLMGAEGLKQDRLGGLDSVKTAARADTAFFVGCAPYFDILFADLGVKARDAARDAVRLLNAAGIVPALLPDERCCGHDLLWSGDKEGFLRLAARNVAEIRKSGAKRVVTACPECYQTLKVDYPHYLGNPGFEVVHISELLAEAVRDGKLKFRPTRARVTYHDPCRLGRFSGIYDAPRAVIGAIPGLELAEMARNRANALCCGTHAWTNCGAVNKQIQVERLTEAAATGATVMLTACPKCQIHLKCALSDGRTGKGRKLRIEDMTSFAARQLVGEEG